jgi:tetratricopeptide (TPR) repeat protein
LFEWGVTNQDVPSIQTAFARLIDLPPEQKNDPAVLTALGAAALQKNRPREAAAWLADAAKLQPGPEAEVRLGRAEQASGRYEIAFQHYEAAIRMDPVYLEAYILMAQLHRSRGNQQAFEATLRRYSRHVPQSLTVRQALATGR